jgi:histidinol-phosphate aminotransferase
LTVHLVRPEVLRLKPYVPGKPIAEVQREYGLDHVVKLASNENPLGPSPLALEALRDVIPALHIYPESTAPALRAALSDRLGLPEQWIMVGNGSDEIFRLLAAAYVRPGDRVLVPGCSFPTYRMVSGLFGAALEEIDLKLETMDLETMAERSAGARIIFLCRPNNPTGAVFSEADFRRFMDRLSDQTLVMLDQAYDEYDETPFDSLALLHEYPNLILTRTFSKAYGLAGLRVGYGLARPEIWSPLYACREPFSVNLLAQAAAIAALEDSEHLEATLDLNRVGKLFLAESLRAIGLHFIPSHANFVMIDMGRPAGPIFESLLRQGIIVRPCSGFGRPNWIRVTIGRPDDNDLLIKALKKRGELES